jgi:hypothetical protein
MTPSQKRAGGVARGVSSNPSTTKTKKKKERKYPTQKGLVEWLKW